MKTTFAQPDPLFNQTAPKVRPGQDYITVEGQQIAVKTITNRNLGFIHNCAVVLYFPGTTKPDRANPYHIQTMPKPGLRDRTGFVTIRPMHGKLTKPTRTKLRAIDLAGDW